MAVTTLEAAAAIEKQERPLKDRCALPLKVLAIANGILLALVAAATSMPELVADLATLAGIPDIPLLRQLDLREPAYMAFAVLWVMAVAHMHVDEINETRLALRYAPESEIIRAFTVEDLIGLFVRATAVLIPAFGLYFFPAYLHGASPIDHLAFALVFAVEFLLWRCVRRG
jgi:hypothetical protein